MAVDLSSRSLFLTVVEVSSLIILNVLSLTGNTLVCILFYTNARLRTTTNLYITALAVSDLLSAVFVMPFATGALITSKWVFGGVVCELQAFFAIFVIYVSTITMGLTAVNRYVRMCKSDQQYKKIFSAWKSRALLASLWIFATCYTVGPRLAGLQTYGFIPAYAFCTNVHLSDTGKIVHYAINITLFFLTPLIATIISYTKVAKKIRQHNTDAASTILRREKNASISLHEIKISRSLFAVVFAFMICWLPFWVIAVLSRFRVVATLPRNVELLCIFLLYLSNTINPFIYAGMNPVFRRELRKVLFCERRRKVGIAPGGGEANTDKFETHRSRKRKSKTLSEMNSDLSPEGGPVQSFTLDTLGVDNSEGVSGVIR